MVSTKIVTSEVLNENKNDNENEGIFLICHQCLWNVTFLNKLCRQKVLGTSNLCPNCNQDQLSSFPVMPNDSFTYSYSKKRGIELNFGIRKT